jgi:hypothetical protein
VPYVICPSCHKIGHAAASRVGPNLCPRCGALLPLRRTVVPVSQYLRLMSGDAAERREAAEALEPA